MQCGKRLQRPCVQTTAPVAPEQAGAAKQQSASGPGSVAHIGWEDKGVSLKLPGALCAKQQLEPEGRRITRVCYLLIIATRRRKRRVRGAGEGARRRGRRRKGRFVDACYVPGAV